MTGLLATVASGTGGAGLRIPHGTAPSAPVNGDVWTTSADLLIHMNGTTRTAVFTDATQTLSNKTLTAPALTDPVITGAITEDVFTITDGVAFEIDPGNGTIQNVTLGASRTPKFTNFANGESIVLRINDGSGSPLPGLMPPLAALVWRGLETLLLLWTRPTGPLWFSGKKMGGCVVCTSEC